MKIFRTMATSLLVVLAGCQSCKSAAGDVGGTIAEYTACPVGLINCGHVFQCTGTPVMNTPSGFVEVCIDDDDQSEQLDEIEALWGMCSPTPRHEGLCIYQCGPTAGSGCNAYSGCYCPR
jgi:hypothetical protein